MKKLTEALKKLFPNQDIHDVEVAVTELVAEARAEIEAEYNGKLAEAYQQVSEDLAAAEAKAEAGYQQAYEIIMDQQLRLEQQAEAYENAMEEGYEEAWEMLEAEKAKNNNIEVEIYNEFDNKLKQMRSFMVDKVHQFLELQNAEIYEQARRDVLNDPRMLEHRVAMAKIAETVASYLSEDDFAGATSAKLEEANKVIEDLKGHLRVLEARNVRISTQNTKLTESVRGLQTTLTESTKVERKERARIAGNASGRGQRALESEQIIAEYHNPKSNKQEDQLDESNDVLNDLLVLAGVVKAE